MSLSGAEQNLRTFGDLSGQGDADQNYAELPADT